MKNILVISVIMAFLFLKGNAQSPIKISVNRNADKSIDFNYTKSDLATYFVQVTLHNLRGANSNDVQYGIANASSGRLFTIIPSRSENGILYNGYNTKIVKGNPNLKIDHDYIYCLPYETGTEIIVNKLNNLRKELFDEEDPDNFISHAIRTQHEVNVLAIRKGKVVKIEDKYELNPDTSYKYKSSTNNLTIEHPDGSFALYKGFKKGSFKVKEGDIVYPQTILGRNEKYNTEDKSHHLSLTIYHVKKSPFDYEPKDRYTYINPKFYINEESTTVELKKRFTVPEYPQHLKTKEYSKKELKQIASQ